MAKKKIVFTFDKYTCKMKATGGISTVQLSQAYFVLQIAIQTEMLRTVKG